MALSRIGLFATLSVTVMSAVMLSKVQRVFKAQASQSTSKLYVLMALGAFLSIDPINCGQT
jgi:hypothetical protein